MPGKELVLKKVPGATQLTRTASDLPPDFSANLSELSALFLDTLLEFEKIKKPLRKALEDLTEKIGETQEEISSMAQLKEYVHSIDRVRDEAELFIVFESSALNRAPHSPFQIASHVLEGFKKAGKDSLRLEPPAQDIRINVDRAWVEVGLQRIIGFVLDEFDVANRPDAVKFFIEKSDKGINFCIHAADIKVRKKIVDEIEGRGVFSLVLPRIIARRHNGFLSIDMCVPEIAREFQGYSRDEIVEFQLIESMDITWSLPAG